jgi:hypothetical protein
MACWCDGKTEPETIPLDQCGNEALATFCFECGRDLRLPVDGQLCRSCNHPASAHKLGGRCEHYYSGGETFCQCKAWNGPVTVSPGSEPVALANKAPTPFAPPQERRTMVVVRGAEGSGD